MSARPRGSSRHHSWPGACWGWAPGTRSAAWLSSAASLSPRRDWEQHRLPPDSPPTHTVCLCLSVKAGVCPEPAAEEANCTMGCQSDGDCESTLKCCPAACGKACQEPNEKPGTCPSVKPGIPMLGLCINQCKMDSNCSGSLKCCRNGCGKVSCVTPLY
ncbi:WAP four-disulfide core domain protein 2-like [Centrocercus urophasianus]|uniref:WAP four-disulfide core domain protein 2-like n=1 Tax=Centrocercus urophasianus TaxID=9002 RepID=UPI001C651FE2|nr:WAP four-disulfide core domain protein 2-like [Centrocercus urophasianus]